MPKNAATTSAGKPGRKPMPDSERLARAVTTRFTDGDLGLIKRAAAASGRRLRDLVRDAVVTEARRVLGG